MGILSLKKCLIHMSQLWAGGPVIPGLLRPTGVEYGRNTHWVVTATPFTTVMNTISIYGRAHTSLTERWQVLFSWYSQLLVRKPSGFLVNLTQRLGLVSGTRGSQLGILLSPRGMAQQKNNKDKFIKTVEPAGVPRMGSGKSYTGLLGTVCTADGYWSQDYIGQETFITGWGPY